MQPQPPSSRLHTLQVSIRQHRVRTIAVGAVLILAALGTIIVANNAPDSKSTLSTPASQKLFRNWLKPTSEIKVGAYRYVSPCQVLRAQDIADAFGPLNPDSSTSPEEYLDTSVSATPQKSFKTECSYLLSNTSGVDALGLKVEQFTDRKYLTTDLSSAANPDEIQALISSYEKVQQEANNADIDAVVTKLKSSLTAYKTYYDSFDTSAIDDTKTGGLLLPGSTDNFGFRFYYNNVAYDFSPLGNRQSISKAQDNGVIKLSAKEIISKLTPAAEVMTKVMSRAKDNKLTQSPGPTILGDSDTYAGTPMLESCSIFDAAAFQTATGQTPNDTIARNSAQLDLTKVRYGKADKQRLYPSNNCTRRFIAAKGTGTSITGFFNLENMGNKANMAKALADRGYRAQDPKITPLQTNATFAIEKDNSGDSGKIYYFQVDNYLGSLFISTLAANGTFAQASREQQVAFINALVPAIQRDARAAKK